MVPASNGAREQHIYLIGIMAERVGWTCDLCKMRCYVTRIFINNQVERHKGGSAGQRRAGGQHGGAGQSGGGG